MLLRLYSYFIDVVARARLRATKTHIIAATSRASLKRREFEACVFSYWENVAINTVATNLSESANAATDGGAGIGSSGDMGGMSEGGLGNRDYYYFADRGRHREHEREEREINQAYLPRMRRHASDQNDFRLFSQQSRRDRDSDNVRSRGDLSPPSQGGSVEALLEHMGRNVGHEDGDIEGDVVSRRRDQGMDFEDGDDFDIAAAIGWIEQLTLNQQGGGSSSRTDLARSSIRPRHGRGSGRGANSSSGGSDIASGGGAADMNALDFSNLLSPAVAVGSDHATADDNNNDDDGNDHASASASLVDTDAVAPVASSVVTATVTATAGTNEGDVAVNVDINERTVGSEAAAAIVAVVGLGDEQVNVEIAAGAPVVDSSRNHHGIVAGQSRAADQILSVLSAEERERLGMAVSARRGRSVEPDEFRSNELLFGALSSREQRRLVNMLRDSGRLSGSSSSRRTGSNRGRTISDSGDGDRDRENAEDPSVFQREHGRRNRLQAAAVAMPPAAPGADTDVNTVASTADSESASPPRLVIESSDGDRHERGRHSRRHHQSQTEVHNDRLLRIALRMEEEEAMERAILMSLQRPTNTNSGGTGEGLGSGSGSAVGGADATANKESLQLLVSMGFDREQCISALIHCNNDVEQATVRLCADIES